MRPTNETIRVDGREIPAAVIAAEAQNHPSDDPDTAWAAASEALAIKALLLAEAYRVGIEATALEDDRGRELAPDDARIEALLESELSTPEADEETCRRYYERHIAQFTSPDLVEASHILFAAPREDESAFAQAIGDAEATISELQEQLGLFSDLAQARSACPSASQGGNLGQLGPGQTVDEFDTFLFNLEEGQLCPVPVKTRYGAHVLKVGRKIAGRTLPFESVRAKIASYLEEASWRRAVAQYIGILLGRARIEGIDLNGNSDPLVQ
ncbi:peptidylprolyl isomerase [Parasphingopyxis algicola]|uniref:peptidylprolyl isomerase n=1 Tax=Parasphingopyxis algicola TaxID=2026624 RepID=UPI0015A3B728|nr:peptidylprolyl isomerase [Parasphingopyxis algicola]QLC26756.1 peptidylprolyl isomerase [Parasphingopyxis algicola]